MFCNTSDDNLQGIIGQPLGAAASRLRPNQVFKKERLSTMPQSTR